MAWQITRNALAFRSGVAHTPCVHDSVSDGDGRRGLFMSLKCVLSVQLRIPSCRWRQTEPQEHPLSRPADVFIKVTTVGIVSGYLHQVIMRNIYFGVYNYQEINDNYLLLGYFWIMHAIWGCGTGKSIIINMNKGIPCIYELLWFPVTTRYLIIKAVYSCISRLSVTFWITD